MKKTLIIVMALCSALRLEAQQISDADRATVERIKQANVDFSTIVSRFTQTRFVKLLGETVKSSGDFFYRKPDKLSMRFTEPAGDLMLLNGDRFVMVNSGKRQEVSAKSNGRMKAMKNILANCLMGDIMGLGAEKITCKETKDSQVVTAVLPSKGNRSNFSKIIIQYNAKSLIISTLRTEEKDGNYTVYELTDKQLDKAIDDKEFNTSKKKK